MRKWGWRARCPTPAAGCLGARPAAVGERARAIIGYNSDLLCARAAFGPVRSAHRPTRQGLYSGRYIIGWLQPWRSGGKKAATGMSGIFPRGRATAGQPGGCRWLDATEQTLRTYPVTTEALARERPSCGRALPLVCAALSGVRCSSGSGVPALEGGRRVGEIKSAQSAQSAQPQKKPP